MQGNFRDTVSTIAFKNHDAGHWLNSTPETDTSPAEHKEL